LRSYLDRLRAERARIDDQISALQGALSTLGMPSGGPGGGRRARSGSLKEFISRVLSKNGGAMAVKDVTAGVMAEGYQTRNQTLSKSVGIALTQMPGVAKVGRGLFKLK